MSFTRPLNRIMVGYDQAVDFFSLAGGQDCFEAGETVFRINCMAVEFDVEQIFPSYPVRIFPFFYSFQESHE